jgi:hypothetical protein
MKLAVRVLAAVGLSASLVSAAFAQAYPTKRWRARSLRQ